MNSFPTKLVGTDFDLLVSIQGHNVLLTGCYCDQFLTPKAARQLADLLREAAAQVEDEMKFDEKCAALTPISTKESTMNEEEMKIWIDNASYRELLSKCRYEPVGSPWFTGEIGEYYEVMMKKKKEQITHEEQVAVSKSLGRNGVPK